MERNDFTPLHMGLREARNMLRTLYSKVRDQYPRMHVVLGIDGVLFSAQSWDDCFQWVIRNGHTTASIYYSGADGVMR